MQRYLRKTKPLRSKLLSTLKAVKLIQSVWKHGWKPRLDFLKKKKLAVYLSKFAKRFYARKVKSANTIKKHYKGFKIFKQFQPLIQEALRRTKQAQSIAKKRKALELNKKRKLAVRTIESAYLEYKQKLKLREIRRYLWTLPYECRELYIKFQQVKRDADYLKADVDQMINKKKITN